MKKNIFVSIFLVLLSTVAFWACNPYKNYSMSISNDSVVLNINTLDDGTLEYESKEVTVTLSGGDKSVAKTVELPISEYVTFTKVSEHDGETKIKVTPKAVGSEDVVIRSTEGNLQSRLHIDVVKPVNSISFIDSANLAIQAGGTLDFSVNSASYIKFNPIDASQKDVLYEVVEEEGKSGYAYFEGSVLHARPLSTGDEIYPTIDGRRYITIKAVSKANSELVATAYVYVVNIVNTQKITMNAETEGIASADIELTPNANGEYEIILAPESIGGQALDNAYASHRVVHIQIGDSSLDHMNYVVNTTLTNMVPTDPNRDDLGFVYNYDSSSANFTFTLTGITPSVVRKTVYVDHKDYIGQFTKAYTFVVKTVNIPTGQGVTLNDKDISTYTDENPLVIYNGYAAAGGSDMALFRMGDSKLGTMFGYTITYDYTSYLYPENHVVLQTSSGVSVINNDTTISNFQTLYIKHEYENVSGEVQYLHVVYRYSLCPPSGNADDYDVYTTEFDIPILLKLGVSQEEVDSLHANYYVSSANDTAQTVLELNTLLVAEEQVSQIIQNNNLVTFSFDGNLIQVKASSKASDGVTVVTFVFANGRVSRNMVFTTYVPLCFNEDDTLYVETEENKLFGIGVLQLDENDELSYDISNHHEHYTVGGSYTYETFTNMIVPSHQTGGLALNIFNLYEDDGWHLIDANKYVVADNSGAIHDVRDNSYYAKWQDGKLYTYNYTTTAIGAGGYPEPVTIILTLTGYVEEDGINSRAIQTINHTLHVWVFDELQGVRLNVTPGTELYDATTIGSKLEESMSTLTPTISTLPYKETMEDFGVTSTLLRLQNPDQIVGPQDSQGNPIPFVLESGEQVFVRLSDIVSIDENGTMHVQLDTSLVNRLVGGLNRSEDYVYEQVFGDGIRCTITGYVSQFGNVKYTSTYVTLKRAIKVSDIILNGVNSSGIYFEYRNGQMTNNVVNVSYTIYPANATNKELDIHFEPLTETLGFVSNYTASIQYNAYGGVITVRLRDGVDYTQMLPQEYMVINALDNYVSDGDGNHIAVVREARNKQVMPQNVLVSYGNGSEEAKFQVRSASDLMRAIADTQSYYYQMANDINVQGFDFVTDSAFKGHMSGKFVYTDSEGEHVNYYNVYGFTMNKTITNTSISSFGLFGTIAHGAEVTDFSVLDALVDIVVNCKQAMDINVGILAGIVNAGTVKNTRVTGQIKITANVMLNNAKTKALQNSINVGGMIGKLQDIELNGEDKTSLVSGYYLGANDNGSYLSNSSVGITVDFVENAEAATWEAGRTYDSSLIYANVGGLVGIATSENSTTTYRTIDKIIVSSTALVNDNIEHGDADIVSNIGGVIGNAKNTNVYEAQVTTSLKGYNVGGVVGLMYYGLLNHNIVEFAYSSGLKNSLQSTHSLGGLVGTINKVQETSDISTTIEYSFVRSYATADISDTYSTSNYNGSLVLLDGGVYVGGLVGTTGNNGGELYVKSSYFDGDINTIPAGDTAKVGGIVGFVDGANIEYSYAKGRIVVASGGKYGMVSGYETLVESQGTTTGYASSVYSTYGSLVEGVGVQTSITDLDYAYDGGAFVITKTTTLATSDVTVKNVASVDMNNVYASFNNNTFMSVGSHTSTYTLRTAQSVKEVIKLVIMYIGNTPVEGTDTKIYSYIIVPQFSTSTYDNTGSTLEVKNYNVIYDGTAFNNLKAVEKEFIYNYYNANHNVQRTQIGEDNYVYNVIAGTTVTVDYVVAETTVLAEGVHSRSVTRTTAEDEATAAWQQGGYYTITEGANIGRLGYVDIVYDDTNITGADANSQLLAILNAPTQVVASTSASTDLENIEIVMEYYKSPTPETIIHDKSDEVAGKISDASITFADVFSNSSAFTTNYRYFVSSFGSGKVTTGRIVNDEPDENGRLYDTEDNDIGIIVSLDGEGDYVITRDDSIQYYWMLIDSINGGMPVIIEPAYDELLQDGILYSGLYTLLPTLGGEVLEYDVFDGEEHMAQDYYKMQYNSLVVLTGETYTFNESSASEDDNYLRPIEILIDSANLSDRTYLYFVSLMSRNELSYSSSNPSVLKVNTNNSTFTAVSAGVSILRVSSKYDDSIFVEFVVTVIDKFTDFEIDNRLSMYVDTEKYLYPTLANNSITNRSTSGNTNAGMLITFGDEEGSITVNNIAQGDTSNPAYDANLEAFILESLNLFRVKALDIGLKSIKVTPFVYVNEQTLGATTITKQDGSTAYILILENMATTVAVNVSNRAKSITVVGNPTSSVTADNVVEAVIAVETYNGIQDEDMYHNPVYLQNWAEENIIFGVSINGVQVLSDLSYTRINQNETYALKDVYDLLNNNGKRKYIIETQFEYLNSTAEMEEGVLLYTHYYKLTLHISTDRYFASISDSDIQESINYTNPLKESIEYKFTFSPSSNDNLVAEYTYTLNANPLTKFDVYYYPTGEVNANGSYNPHEVKSQKVVPGKTGLFRIIPQKQFNALNYVEVVTLDYASDISFSQVTFNDAAKRYVPTEYSATAIPGGIRLWNISNSGYYDGTYYVNMRTSSTLAQGVNIRIQVTAYDTFGQVLYSQVVTYVTDYLPYINTSILDDQGAYKAFTEVSLYSATPIRFESAYLDEAVSYNIKTENSDSNQVFQPIVGNTTSNGNHVFLTTNPNPDEWRNYIVEKGNPRLVNGTTYYLVVTDEFDLFKDIKGNKLVVEFTGQREINGMIEYTSSSFTVQVVYVKLRSIVMDESYPEGSTDVLQIRTGESTQLLLNMYSKNSSINSGFLATQKEYLRLIAKVISGMGNNGYLTLNYATTTDTLGLITSTDNTKYSFSIADSVSYIIQRGNDAATSTTFNYMQSSWASYNKSIAQNNPYSHYNTEERRIDPLEIGFRKGFYFNQLTDYDGYVVQGITIDRYTMYVNFRYYYDENGLIQLYNKDYFESCGDSGIALMNYIDTHYVVHEFPTYMYYLDVLDGSTEDRPTPIYSAQEFIDMLAQSEGNFILCANIELDSWVPVPINVDSLDGNSYRIYLKSFDFDKVESTANMGLFSSVGSSGGKQTLIKNLTLDLSKFTGNITAQRSIGSAARDVQILDFTELERVNTETGEKTILDVTSLTFGWFAAQNSGCITNCAVVNANVNTVEFEIRTHQVAKGSTIFTAQVAGFVATNSGSISNSFVGKLYGDNGMLEVATADTPESTSTPLNKVQTYAFDISAGQKLAGFVITNSGTISNSYVKSVGLNNLTKKADSSLLAGFVGTNNAKIYNCFVEADTITDFRANTTVSPIGWQLTSVGGAAGFVYDNANDSTIENAYAQMGINVNSVITGGFAFTTTGSIKNAYTTTINIKNPDSGSLAHGPFVAKAWDSNDNKLYGELIHCYYYVKEFEAVDGVVKNEFGVVVSNEDDPDAALAYSEIMSTIDPAKPIGSLGYQNGTKSNFQSTAPFEGFSIYSISPESDISKDYLWYVNSAVTNANGNVGPKLSSSLSHTTSYRRHEEEMGQGIDPVTGNPIQYHVYTWHVAHQLGTPTNPIVLNSPENFVRNIVQNSRKYTISENGTEKNLYIFGVTSSEKEAKAISNIKSHVRVVNDINLNEQALNAKYYINNSADRCALTEIIFSGELDGNGMTISGIKMSSNEQNLVENYGLYAQIGLSDTQQNATIVGRDNKLSDYVSQTPRIFNINFAYTEVSNPSAQKVGVLAGSIYNATLRMISITGPQAEAGDNVSLVSGWNLVGGLAGLIAGAGTNIADVTLTNIRLVSNKNTLNVDQDDINLSGYYDNWSNPLTPNIKSSFRTISVTNNYTITNLADISYAGALAGVVLSNNYKLLDYYTYATGENKTHTAKTLQESATDPSRLRLKADNPEDTANILRDSANTKLSGITVTGIIDITADQAGGMIGYLGSNSHLLDSAVIIDKTTGNYQNIYGYNYSAGLVAEMKGSVVERTEVRHDTATQDAIDSAINKALPANISALNIFKSSDVTRVSNVSVAMGGLVGYMQNSAILDSNSKINVTNEDGKVAGGLVGYANNFNYIGYAYTTGDVLAKEVIGGLVGLYTYDVYKLYLQETFALNRWGSEINATSVIKKLQANHYSIYGKSYEESTTKQLVMPEIGNLYNGTTYGDFMPDGNTFTFIGSVLGKATLAPGDYRYSAEHEFVIGTDGVLYKTDGTTKLTNTELSGGSWILDRYDGTKYVKNLFVDAADKSTSGSGTYSGNTHVCLPLYTIAEDTITFNTSLGLWENDNSKDMTTQRVLDKKLRYNTYNFNVISTTYSKLNETKVNNIMTKMTYFSNGESGDSFVLDNNYMSIEYTRNSGMGEMLNNNAAYIAVNENVHKYPSVLGKQTYLEMITGYFFSNELTFDNKGGYNAQDVGFDNQFNTTWGYTKQITNLSKAISESGPFIPGPSSTWYKQPKNNIYFPEYSYGKKSSFDYITSATQLKKALSEESSGKFYMLKPSDSSNTISYTFNSNNTQEFNDTFGGIVIGVQNTSGQNPKIVINMHNSYAAQALLIAMDNATFVNVDFELNINKSEFSVDGQGSGTSSYGMLARNVRNTVFSNCNFVVKSSKSTLSFTKNPEGSTGLNAMAYFGYVFGEVHGITLLSCTYELQNNSSGMLSPTITLDANATTGSYGLFAGLVDSANIDKFTYKVGNVTFKLGGTTEAPLAGNSGFNFGALFGSLSKSKLHDVTDLSGSGHSITIDGNSNVFRMNYYGYLNVGLLAGSITNASSLDSIYINSNTSTTYTAIKLNNVQLGIGDTPSSLVLGDKKPAYITAGLLAGFVHGSNLDNVCVCASGTEHTYNTSGANITVIGTTKASATFVGGVVGSLNKSSLTATRDTNGDGAQVRANITINGTFSDPYSNESQRLFVGGVVGAAGSLIGESISNQKPGSSANINGESLSVVSSHVFLGSIKFGNGINNCLTTGKYYVGGIAGYTCRTSVTNNQVYADIDLLGAPDYGYGGGIIGYSQFSARNVSSITNNLSTGHMMFRVLKNSNYHGGFIGFCTGTTSIYTTDNEYNEPTEGNQVIEVSNNCAYMFMDYSTLTTDFATKFDLSRFDIVCTTNSAKFNNVHYIVDMMPVRNSNAIISSDYAHEYKMIYNNWSGESYDYLASVTLDAVRDYTKYVYSIFGTNALGSLFNPFTNLSVIDSAEKGKVYIVAAGTLDTSNNSSPNIGGSHTATDSKRAMVVSTGHTTVTPATVSGTSQQFSNNALLTGFTFILTNGTSSDNNNVRTLFSNNNGSLYNVSVYGDISRTDKMGTTGTNPGYATVANYNNGYICNVNASVTYLGTSVNFYFSGLVITNNAVIKDVVSTSGTMGLSYWGTGTTYYGYPIAKTNNGTITNALFAGVMNISSNITKGSIYDVTTCTTTTNALSGKSYYGLFNEYTATKGYASSLYVNFGIPYIESAGTIPTYGRGTATYTGSGNPGFTNCRLHNADDGTSYFVRTIADLYAVNKHIVGGGRNYVLCDNIKLEGGEGQNPYLFREATALYGNGKTITGGDSQLSLTYALVNSASALTELSNIKFNNIRIETNNSLGAYMIKDVTTLNNVEFTNITINSSVNGCSIGIIKNAETISSLVATNIDLGASVSLNSAQYVGIISKVTGTVTSSYANTININANNNIASLIYTGALAGSIGGSITGRGNTSSNYSARNILINSNSSRNAYIGGLVGKLNGNANSIYAFDMNLTYNLNEETYGSTYYLGGIFGYVGGNITSTTFKGNMNINNVPYLSNSKTTKEQYSGALGEFAYLPYSDGTHSESWNHGGGAYAQINFKYKKLFDINVSDYRNWFVDKTIAQPKILLTYEIKENYIRYIAGNKDGGTVNSSSTMNITQKDWNNERNDSGLLVYTRIAVLGETFTGVPSGWETKFGGNNKKIELWVSNNKNNRGFYVVFREDGNYASRNGVKVGMHTQIIMGKCGNITLNSNYTLTSDDVESVINSGSIKETRIWDACHYMRVYIKTTQRDAAANLAKYYLYTYLSGYSIPSFSFDVSIWYEQYTYNSFSFYRKGFWQE